MSGTRFRINGQPASWQRRYRLFDLSVNSADPIFINHTWGGSAIIESVYIKFSAIPADTTDFVIRRESPNGPEYGVDLVVLNFNTLGILEKALWGPCCAWRFEPSDRIVVTYPNIDDDEVGVEILGSGMLRNKGASG